jgi:hypothetical protein
MVYDAADGRVVLFGGAAFGPAASGILHDTWTWDGIRWTNAHPAHSPSARIGSAIVYDPADGTVVLFGGYNPNFDGYFHDTWTWDGTDWTKEFPKHSPSQRAWTGLAYDDAAGEVVLFGGGRRAGVFADTWTWDGTDWMKAHPAHRPPPRAAMSMSYASPKHGSCCSRDTHSLGSWTMTPGRGTARTGPSSIRRTLLSTGRAWE